MEAPLISYIIVTYNSGDTISPCVASIHSHTGSSYEVIIVDNSPSGETKEAIEKLKNLYPEMRLRLIRPAENIGFGRGCNLGARETTGEYLFFLNPDTELLNDVTERLIDGLRQGPKAVMAGPAIQDAGGKVTRTCRNLPTLMRIALDATGLDRWLGFYRLTRFAHDRPRMVEQIIGAAMLMRRTDFDRAGGMDEQFFIYFEEVDLCNRMRGMGGEIWFWPDGVVRHLAGKSCETDSVRARMIYVLRESRRKYFAKHFGATGALLMEGINRVEAVEKVVVLGALWLLSRRPGYREKMNGFRAVATGNTSRL